MDRLAAFSVHNRRSCHAANRIWWSCAREFWCTREMRMAAGPGLGWILPAALKVLSGSWRPAGRGVNRPIRGALRPIRKSTRNHRNPQPKPPLPQRLESHKPLKNKLRKAKNLAEFQNYGGEAGIRLGPVVILRCKLPYILCLQILRLNRLDVSTPPTWTKTGQFSPIFDNIM